MRIALTSVSRDVIQYLVWGLLLIFAWAWRGPAGAILVLAAGIFLRRGMRYGWWALKPGAVKETCIYSQFAALGQLAKASGRVTEADIHSVEQLMGQMKLASAQRDVAIDAFTRGRRWQAGVRHAAIPFHFQRFKQLAEQHPEMQKQFFRILVACILRQGRKPLAQEYTVLQSLANRVGAAESLVIECLEANRAQRPQMSSHSAYEELGLHEEVSDQEIKQAYRSLMRRYHPDKMAANHVTQEERDLAEARVRKVRAAYDELKRLRGFR